MSNAHEMTPLRFLSRAQIEMIDEALAAVAPFGEVQLIVEKGRLRFVVTKNSHDALNWSPESIKALGGQRSVSRETSKDT